MQRTEVDETVYAMVMMMGVGGAIVVIGLDEVDVAAVVLIAVASLTSPHCKSNALSAPDSTFAAIGVQTLHGVHALDAHTLVSVVHMVHGAWRDVGVEDWLERLNSRMVD